jgi:hypothetical protein
MFFELVRNRRHTGGRASHEIPPKSGGKRKHMTQTIWKYPLETTDDQDIEAPDNATVLDVQMQHDRPCLWMLVDPNIPVRIYHVKTFGTGHPVRFDDAYVFAGTYQLANGNFIGHVFVA